MEEGREAKQDRTMKSILLMISCTMLGIGVCGGPLISRLYFIHGGNRVWLSSFLQAAGFPIILLPLFISFVIRRRQITSSVDSSKVKMFNMKLPLFVFSAIIEILAVIFYKETFKAEKGVSLVLSIWGFVSYFYGEYKQGKKMKMNQVPTNAMPQDHSISNP
ncbi:hypothetical protein RIF29_21013 [Crotalaria pallida]|uniref:Uncharacterized protein n=1 Tax=Crotalaria pallida TaxID=3830 RepID=A0AAN9ID02_CROPI